MIYELHYNIANGGDGSVGLNYFESKELAQWDEEHDPEPYAEETTSSLKFESDAAITCTNVKLETKEEYFIDRIVNDGYSVRQKVIDEFLKKFFPDGFPVCTSTVAPVPKDKFMDKDYNEHKIFIGDRLIGATWEELHTTTEEVLASINKYN